MRARALVPLALGVVGVALIVLAVLRGGATAGVVLVIPFVAGSSPILLVGVLALIGAFLTLPLAFGSVESSEEAPGTPAASGTPAVGGLVVIGPVPIFFGSWSSAPTWVRFAAALAGAVLLVIVVLLLLGVVP